MPQIQRSSLDNASRSETSRDDFEEDEESKRGQPTPKVNSKLGLTFGALFGSAINSKTTENDEVIGMHFQSDQKDLMGTGG